MNTIVNGIIPPEGAANPLFAARSEMQALYLAQIERQFSLPKQRMILIANEIKGLKMLAELGEHLYGMKKVTA